MAISETSFFINVANALRGKNFAQESVYPGTTIKAYTDGNPSNGEFSKEDKKKIYTEVARIKVLGNVSEEVIRERTDGNINEPENLSDADRVALYRVIRGTNIETVLGFSLKPETADDFVADNLLGPGLHKTPVTNVVTSKWAANEFNKRWFLVYPLILYGIGWPIRETLPSQITEVRQSIIQTDLVNFGENNPGSIFSPVSTSEFAVKGGSCLFDGVNLAPVQDWADGINNPYLRTVANGIAALRWVSVGYWGGYSKKAYNEGRPSIDTFKNMFDEGAGKIGDDVTKSGGLEISCSRFLPGIGYTFQTDIIDNSRLYPNWYNSEFHGSRVEQGVYFRLKPFPFFTRFTQAETVGNMTTLRGPSGDFTVKKEETLKTWHVVEGVWRKSDGQFLFLDFKEHPMSYSTDQKIIWGDFSHGMAVGPSIPGIPEINGNKITGYSGAFGLTLENVFLGGPLGIGFEYTGRNMQNYQSGRDIVWRLNAGGLGTLTYGMHESAVQLANAAYNPPKININSFRWDAPLDFMDLLDVGGKGNGNASAFIKANISYEYRWQENSNNSAHLFGITLSAGKKPSEQETARKEAARQKDPDYALLDDAHLMPVSSMNDINKRADDFGRVERPIAMVDRRITQIRDAINDDPDQASRETQKTALNAFESATLRPAATATMGAMAASQISEADDLKNAMLSQVSLEDTKKLYIAFANYKIMYMKVKFELPLMLKAVKVPLLAKKAEYEKLKSETTAKNNPVKPELTALIEKYKNMIETIDTMVTALEGYEGATTGLVSTTLGGLDTTDKASNKAITVAQNGVKKQKYVEKITEYNNGADAMKNFLSARKDGFDIFFDLVKRAADEGTIDRSTKALITDKLEEILNYEDGFARE